MDNFAVFILTHGRADNVVTYKSLLRGGYTGDVYLVIDDTDEQAGDYISRYGDKVVVFDKKLVAAQTDTGDLSDDLRAIVFARNVCYTLAAKMGITYFLMLDDDYPDFVHKFTHEPVYRERRIKNLDRIFALYLAYYIGGGFTILAMAQNWDYIGGGQSTNARKIRLVRKAMNTMFASVLRPVEFTGRMNEDVTAYVLAGQRGELFATVGMCAVIHNPTQQTKGGMSASYADGGTYMKSFMTVMNSPSNVVVSTMGDKHKRVHHRISWVNTAVKIVSEEYKKWDRKLN